LYIRPVYARRGSELWAEDLRRQIAELGLERSVGLVPFQRRTAAAYRITWRRGYRVRVPRTSE
jgi:hypothetical protein